MNDSSHEPASRRTLKENLQETVDILTHSKIGLPKAIVIAAVILAVASILA